MGSPEEDGLHLDQLPDRIAGWDAQRMLSEGGGGRIHDPLQKLGPPHPAGHGWQRDFPEAECVPWHTLVVDTAGTTDMQKLVLVLNSVYRHVYSPGLRGLDSIKDLSSER